MKKLNLYNIINKLTIFCILFFVLMLIVACSKTNYYNWFRKVPRHKVHLSDSSDTGTHCRFNFVFERRHSFLRWHCHEQFPKHPQGDNLDWKSGAVQRIVENNSERSAQNNLPIARETFPSRWFEKIHFLFR